MHFLVLVSIFTFLSSQFFTLKDINKRVVAQPERTFVTKRHPTFTQFCQDVADAVEISKDIETIFFTPNSRVVNNVRQISDRWRIWDLSNASEIRGIKSESLGDFLEETFGMPKGNIISVSCNLKKHTEDLTLQIIGVIPERYDNVP